MAVGTRRKRRVIRRTKPIDKMMVKIEMVGAAIAILADEALSVDQPGGTYDPYFDAVVLSCRTYRAAVDMPRPKAKK